MKYHLQQSYKTKVENSHMCWKKNNLLVLGPHSLPHIDQEAKLEILFLGINKFSAYEFQCIKYLLGMYYIIINNNR